MRQRALEADIVVVNHHLLCADLAVKDGSYGEVIPRLRHRDPRRGAPARGRGHPVLRRPGLLAPRRGPVPRRGARAEGRAPRRAATCSRSWTPCATAPSASSSRSPRARGRRLGPGWMTAARGRGGRRAARAPRRAAHRAPRAPRAAGAADRPGRPRAGLRQELAFVLAAEDDGHVYFVETRGRGVFLRATPIDVSARLRELLFDQVRAAVLTSATLAVDGGFELPEGAPRPRADGRAAAALALRLRGAGRPLRAAAHARAALAGVRGPRGGGDRAPPRA